MFREAVSQWEADLLSGEYLLAHDAQCNPLDLVRQPRPSKLPRARRFFAPLLLVAVSLLADSLLIMVKTEDIKPK